MSLPAALLLSKFYARVWHETDVLLPVQSGGAVTYRFVKDADKAIIGKLKEAGRIVHVAVERHSYPFCWRSETPLIYKVPPCHAAKRYVHCLPVLMRAAFHTAEHRITECRRCPAGSSR